MKRCLLGLFLVFLLLMPAVSGAYVYQTMQYPGATSTMLNGLNDNGQMTLVYQDSNFQQHSVFYDGTNYTPIVMPDAVDVFACALNNLGQTVGFYTDSNGKQHGFVYDTTTQTYTTFDYPGADWTWLRGINDNGIATGIYGTLNSNDTHSFLYNINTGEITDINYPGATSTEVFNINNAGQYIGYALGHNFYFDGSSFFEVTIPGATDIFYSAINDQGDIAGYFHDANNTLMGFIFNMGTQLYETFDVIQGATDFWPHEINNLKQLVGMYDGGGFYTLVEDNNIYNGLLFEDRAEYSDEDFVGSAMTPDGGVVVTVKTKTLKYDTDGNLLWEAPYTNYVGPDPIVDSQGNIFLIGSDPFASDGINIYKLSQEGNLLWQKQYLSSTNSSPQSAVTDGDNIFISLYTENGPRLVKFTNQGSLLWDIPTSSYGKLLYDTNNDAVYIKGLRSILKIDSSGNILWEVTYSNTNVYGHIELDGFGNVIIAYSDNSNSIILKKYDSNGNLLWEQSFTTNPTYGFGVTDIAIDSSGNILVGGEAWYYTYGGEAYVTKYDPMGNQQWYKEIHVSLSNNCQKITTDIYDNVFCVGYTWNYSRYYGLVAMLNRNGDITDIKDRIDSYSFLSTYSFDRVYYSNTNNSIFVVGSGYDKNLGHRRMVIAKYSIDNDGDGFVSSMDCNDRDPAINPGAIEIPYNGIDENCNGMQDDDDLDLDGYGIATDCNDSDASINPAAVEIPYNGIDENCNGMQDDDDLDLDGYGIATDCNDSDASIHPGATEIKLDGIDQDCNGYDLTINITKAEYRTKGDELNVEATTALNSAAALELTGYGPMTWDAKKGKWKMKIRHAGGNPGTVSVCGVEGCENAKVVVKVDKKKKKK